MLFVEVIGGSLVISLTISAYPVSKLDSMYTIVWKLLWYEIYENCIIVLEINMFDLMFDCIVFWCIYGVIPEIFYI